MKEEEDKLEQEKQKKMEDEQAAAQNPASCHTRKYGITFFSKMAMNGFLVS